MLRARLVRQRQQHRGPVLQRVLGERERAGVACSADVWGRREHVMFRLTMRDAVSTAISALLGLVVGGMALWSAATSERTAGDRVWLSVMGTIVVLVGVALGVGACFAWREVRRLARWDKAAADERLAMIEAEYPTRVERARRSSVIGIFRRVWAREMTPEEGAIRLGEIREDDE
jgi:hypothetical protein